MASAPRSINQLKCQWSVIKMTAKRDNAGAKRELFKTGGGPAIIQQETTSDDIRSWLPGEFAVDSNEFDSDQVEISAIEILEVLNYTAFLTINFLIYCILLA